MSPLHKSKSYLDPGTLPRLGGVLLHPTSLPGPEGCGTLGAPALEFLDFACQAGLRLWQVCPLGPTGYGDSPYQCLSAFAGNPVLVDAAWLKDRGLLDERDLASLTTPDPGKVDYGSYLPKKFAALAKAAANFFRLHGPDSREYAAYGAFCQREADWLEDWCLFSAIKAEQGGRPWNEWPVGLRDRHDQDLATARSRLAEGIARARVWQYWFFAQWQELKAAAAVRGIAIMGDTPIFVAYDSADVWAGRRWFALDEQGLPTVVAGVPPDYFSPTGQLWGNPLYDWEAMAADGYAWWIRVLAHKHQLFDWVRIDHFRGFAAYWAVPYGDPTAERGTWTPAPGRALFAALRAALGDLPIVAEDLGLITPDVVELMEECGFPGMKVLQFAFDSADASDHVPHRYRQHSLVYTGTHDNDTVCGWYANAREDDRQRTRDYLVLSDKPERLHLDFIRAACATVSAMAIFPLQDILGLGSEARFNLPGSMGGNWTWRCLPGALTDRQALDLRELLKRYGRA